VAQLIQLKQKIQSIKKTKKITHAVRLVSMSLYSKIEKQRDTIENYKNSIFQLFGYVKKYQPEWKHPILMPQDLLDTTPLFIIISTTKGFCGSLNSNLFRYLDKALFLEKHQKPHFITIGQKAKNYIETLTIPNQIKVICSYNEINSSNYSNIADEIIEITHKYKKPFSSVVFYSNKIQNFFIQTPQKTTIIPTTINVEEEHRTLEPLLTEKSSIIMDALVDAYLKSSMLDLLFQAMLSEQASRFLAMDSATNNAEKYLDQLILQYNKSRQALITREVSELSAGFQN